MITKTTHNRKPIQGGFRVLVVPTGEVIQHPGKTTNPEIMNDPANIMIPNDHTGAMRIMAQVHSTGVSMAEWAFDARSKKKVADDLRKLATYIEKGIVVSSPAS